MIAADLTMFVDVVVAGGQVNYLDSPLVLYRGHSGQIGMDTRARATPSQATGNSLAHARWRTRQGWSPSEARSDLVRAARLWHGVLGPKWLAIGAISLLPHLGPIFERVSLSSEILCAIGTRDNL